MCLTYLDHNTIVSEVYWQGGASGIIAGHPMSTPDATSPRRYRAGDAIEDVCRACKTLREHRVLAVDGEGQLQRVVCGYCGSQHNYRGGERAPRPAPAPAGSRAAVARPEWAPGRTDALVSERERRYPMASMDGEGGIDMELLLRRVIREELGLTPVSMADRWRGGELVVKPGKPGVQEKSWPIDSLFHKVVMIRNKLRTLEQVVNASTLTDDEKVKIQGYITGCYGSLTSFNLLFADEEDRFSGAGGGG